ncbi:TAXI family TRAP transporter solute-binding subunit [Ammoniphilus sp. CFH 90114]|uniref:TAXI family TRAP transporter solute-binding subunit n=1 Tax=Ammoniphilus sp. CFH 90114 TaxID=2493665 RepID=UPI00100E91E9|nr:TAXI family TRAP transporter solute-binding subunit [Ammoniphilus sp. CFH 90114]RXT02373.1 TAXI family TRAP transporter solute-binding subunit [Ammoniphilus sp. CFH 90114]
MKKLLSTLCTTALLFSAVVGCSSSQDTSNANPQQGGASGSKSESDYKPEPSNIILASGPIGGGWYASAAAISEVLMREIPGLNVTVTEGGGVANIKDVSSGAAQIGYTFSDTFNDAVNGNGDFNGSAADNISGLSTLYQSFYQVIALEDNSKFQTLGDLKNGANILPGKKTFSGQVFTSNLLEKYYGTTYQQIEENGGKISLTGYSEMTDLLKDGHADVAMAMTDAPSSFIMELNAMKKVRFLEVDPETAKKVEESNPGYVAAQLPANTYDGQTEPVNTIGSYTVMMLSNDIPAELAERIAKAIVENKDELAQSQPSLSFVDKSTLKDGFKGAPVHPGVEAYLQ